MQISARATETGRGRESESPEKVSSRRSLASYIIRAARVANIILSQIAYRKFTTTRAQAWLEDEWLNREIWRFSLSLSLGERSTKESMRKRYIYASPRLQDFPGVVVGCVFFLLLFAVHRDAPFYWRRRVYKVNVCFDFYGIVLVGNRGYVGFDIKLWKPRGKGHVVEEIKKYDRKSWMPARR